MTMVEQIQSEITALPPKDYVYLRQWFLERDWEQWDQQFEQDAVSGKLDFLLQEALSEKAQRQLREL